MSAVYASLSILLCFKYLIIHLPHFFRSSFKKLKEKNTQNLVIDLRSNGGGSVTNSNLLTKFIADKPFRIADSLYALRHRLEYQVVAMHP